MKTLFGAIVVLSLYSCGGGATSVVDGAGAVGWKISPLPQTTYPQGGIVDIRVAAHSETADSIFINIGGKRIVMEDGKYSCPIPSDSRTGRIRYKIEFFKGGAVSEKSSEFIVVAAAEPVAFTYSVKKTYPHDTDAYTQGLYWHEGRLYEGTGLNGKSSLRKVELTSGKVLKSTPIDEKYFGEGIALHNGRIYQLTWQNNEGFIYDGETFEKIGGFGYPTEGWGLTTDGERLYMSDGTERIFIIDPEGFRTLGTIEVYDNRGKIVFINELEWIEGEIWGNIYQSDMIVRIDPSTGAVTGVVNMAGLLKPSDITPSTDVLNGIAYDAASKRVFVTGKNWNKLFEIEITRR